MLLLPLVAFTEGFYKRCSDSQLKLQIQPRRLGRSSFNLKRSITAHSKYSAPNLDGLQNTAGRRD